MLLEDAAFARIGRGAVQRLAVRIDVVAVPDRDLVPPPELAGDAPGLDVLEPVVVGLLLALGQDAGAAVADRLEGRAGELRGVDVPLVGQERLDRDLGAVAVRDGVDLRVDAVEPALLLGEGDDQLARLVAVEAVEVGELVGGARALPEGGVVLERDPGAGVHDVDRGEAGALADLPVVEVVGRGDLDRAGALRGVGVGVGDDRDRCGRPAAGGRSCRRGGRSAGRRGGRRRRCRRAWSRGGWWRRRGSRGSRRRWGCRRRRRRSGARRSRRPRAGSAGARGGPWPRPARPRGRRSRSRSAGPS